MTTKSVTPKILVPVVEEVPRISDRERSELLASLEQGRVDIAAGNYDVVTSQSLRAEFEAIYHGNKTDEEFDAELPARSPRDR